MLGKDREKREQKKSRLELFARNIHRDLDFILDERFTESKHPWLFDVRDLLDAYYQGCIGAGSFSKESIIKLGSHSLHYAGDYEEGVKGIIKYHIPFNIWSKRLFWRSYNELPGYGDSSDRQLRVLHSWIGDDNGVNDLKNPKGAISQLKRVAEGQRDLIEQIRSSFIRAGALEERDQAISGLKRVIKNVYSTSVWETTLSHEAVQRVGNVDPNQIKTFFRPLSRLQIRETLGGEVRLGITVFDQGRDMDEYTIDLTGYNITPRLRNIDVTIDEAREFFSPIR